MHALVAASAVTAALLRYCCGVGEWVSCHYEDARTFDDMAEGTHSARFPITRPKEKKFKGSKL